MPSYTATIKVKKEVAVVVDEMIKLGIAKNKNQAYNMLIEAGLPKIKALIERKRRVRELVNEFLDKGLPYEKLPTVNDVEEGRGR